MSIENRSTRRKVEDVLKEIDKHWRTRAHNAIRVILPDMSKNPPKVNMNLHSHFLISPLFLLNVHGISATAREIKDTQLRFVVLKGSKARRDPTPSMSPSKVDLRERLIQDRKLAISDKGDNLVFVEDVMFNSPSQAASIITGNPRSGPQIWVEKDTGKSYKDWEKEEPRRWAVSFCMKQTMVA